MANSIAENVNGITDNTSRQETIEMIKHFHQNHVMAMNENRIANGPLQVAHSAWFNLSGLEEYLKELRKKKADGVRVYFGAYNQKENADYGYNTLIFVGTKEQSTTKGGTKNTDLPSPSTEDENYAFTIPSGGFSTTDFNHGHLCPPNCDGGEEILCEAVPDKCPKDKQK